MISKTILSVVTVATAVCALASLKSDAFAPAQLSFFPRRTKKLCAGDDDKGEEPKKPIDREQDDSRSGSNEELRYLQDDLTRAREAETRPADSDFSGATSAFDRPITVKNSYGDDAVGMVKHLPALFDQSKQLENTELGQKYASLRLPIFILGSNKLEGTLSPHASEGDTFDFLLKYVENGTDAVHLIPSGEDEDEQQITWEADGNSNTTEAWYEQCMCHLRALVMMLDWAKAGEPLTTEKMLACHSVLMKGAVTSTGTAFQSRFRHDDDESAYAAQYVFPVRIDHEENMANLLDQMNSKFGTVHPVEWSCDLLLKVLSAHPFLNGNGRMARLCYAYGLVRHGVPCAVVFSDWHSKARGHYIGAVKEAQGQKGVVKVESLYTMGTVGLFATLQNMCTFCEQSTTRSE